MAQVLSLGIQTPTTLSFAVQESLLPPNPPESSYTYSTSLSLPNDEILVTSSAVIWSQGGIIRRVFKFDVEKEKVLSAVITWFPSDDPKDVNPEGLGKDVYDVKDTQQGVPGLNAPKKRVSAWNSKSRTYTAQLGDFPRAKGSIGMLAPPLPEQDEAGQLMTPSGRARALVVFLRSQAHVFFLSGTSFIVNLPFETIYALPSPRGVIIQGKMARPRVEASLLDDDGDNEMSEDGDRNGRADTPCLFTLTDPLLDVGVALNAETQSTLDGEEELIFFSESSELEATSPDVHGYTFEKDVFGGEVVFAVTRNRERGALSIWNVRYVPHEFPSVDKRPTPLPSGAASRRRSSFGPAAQTGSTTPVAGGGGAIPIGSFAKPEPISLEFEKPNTRSSNRRVSSLVSRADLGGSIDRIPYSDIGTAGNSFRHTQETGGYSQESRFAPRDSLLDELNTAEMLSMGFVERSGLRSEIVMNKIESLPIPYTVGQKEDIKPKVFTLLAPATTTAINGVKSILLCILDKADNTLTQLTFILQSHTVAGHGPTSAANFRKTKGKRDEKLITPRIHDITRHSGVLDAIKIVDGGVSRLLLLSVEGQLQLHSPWSPPVPLQLPMTLARWNTNVFGSQPRQRKGFTRVLSEMPEGFQRLEHAEQGGRVTIVDHKGIGHRLAIQMAPREATVRLALDSIRVMLGVTMGSTVGEGIYTTWMETSAFINRKLGNDGVSESKGDVVGANDWTAFVVTLFLFAVAELPPEKPVPRRRSGLRRSGSAIANLEWDEMVNTEGEWGSTPEYMRNPAWSWMIDEEEERNREFMQQKLSTPQLNSKLFAPKKHQFLKECISLAREFAASETGKRVYEYLPRGKMDKSGGERKTGYAGILVTLHLLREELKLDITMDLAVRRLAAPLCQLAKWIGWDDWAQWYLLEDAEVDGWEFDDKSKIKEPDVPDSPFKIPSIYDWVSQALTGTLREAFVSLEDLAMPQIMSQQNSSQIIPTANINKPIFASLTPRTKLVTEIYACLITPGRSHIDVISAMERLKFTPGILERLPDGIAIPLKEAIARCQEEPPTTWGPRELELVERRDLMLLSGHGKPKGDFSKWQTAPTHEAARDVHHICSTTSDSETLGSYDSMAEADRHAVSRLIFREDRRLHEAVRLLQASRPPVTKFVPEPGMGENDILEAERLLAYRVAIRTLSVCTGRGLLHYNSRIPLLTEKFPIPGFSFSCVVKPSNRTVTPDRNALAEDRVSWAYFHAGVAAGLSVSKEAKEIDTSWIVFNKPPDPGHSNRHAGFLLGLGLNGHLRNIAKWHAFSYLTPKHTMTSIGLLLGLSASYLGTMDTTITKLLSVHVTRLLPPGSAELNLSPLTQTAGIMGIGILYSGTQHRRMSEVMLSEIEHIEVGDQCINSDPLRNEGYRLAAGFSLGFINLGAGRDLRGLHDLHLVERLLALAVDSKEVSKAHILDKTTAGATIALALIYMKTNEESLAKKIDIPDTVHLFDYVRPDILLLRTVARHLIMWDSIDGSFEWIKSNLKDFHKDKYKLDIGDDTKSDDMPLYNILAGLCLSIALKYAGSADLAVRDVLVHYLDQFMRLYSIPVQTYDKRLARTALRNCQDLLALCASCIMAGTGDLVVFRRLRSLHARVDEEIYGSHFATHMAIGILFLGGGSFTLGTSNLAVASLLCAFYPIFPTNILDSRFHLQAFRHFWVMAAEPRCLVPRDVETNRPCSIPIEVTLKTGQILTRTAPCLLPELDAIARITTVSPSHWTVTLDFAKNPLHLHVFRSTQTIYLNRRSAHASTSTVFQATLQALSESLNTTSHPPSLLQHLFTLLSLSHLDRAEQRLLLPPDAGNPANISVETNVVDTRLVLSGALSGWETGNADRLRGLKLVMKFAGGMGERGIVVGGEWGERLGAGVAVVGME